MTKSRTSSKCLIVLLQNADTFYFPYVIEKRTKELTLQCPGILQVAIKYNRVGPFLMDLAIISFIMNELNSKVLFRLPFYGVSFISQKYSEMHMLIFNYWVNTPRYKVSLKRKIFLGLRLYLKVQVFVFTNIKFCNVCMYVCIYLFIGRK